MVITPSGSSRGDAPAVSGSAGYWVQVTPSTTPLSANGFPCDAVYVDTDGATVTGKRGAVGPLDTATASPPLAAKVPHALSFYTITAVSSGNVWAIWYSNPLV